MYQQQPQEELINQSDLYLYFNNNNNTITTTAPNAITTSRSNSLIDVKEEDEDEDMEPPEKYKSKSRRSSMNKAERRAEHNAIERARRECLNSKFQQLAEALPNLQNHRRPSKGQIVEKALDWVKQNMTKEDRYQYQIMQLQNENKRLLCQINIIQDKQKQTNTGVITPPPQTPTHYTNELMYMPHPLEFHHPFQQQQMDFLLPQPSGEDDNDSHSSNEDMSHMQLLYNDISHYQVLEAMNHPLFKQTQKPSFYS